MDSITQAVLGASIGEVMFGKKHGGKAAIAGAIIATVPDLDIIFHLFYDKFEILSIHRGYSHSILFCVLSSFLIAFSLRKFKWSKGISYLRLYIFSFLTLLTHVLLDACTAYGTSLFLPFSDERVSWDMINVVDPVYTLPMLAGLFFSLVLWKNKSNRSLPTIIGLGISTLYLLSTLVVKSQVNHYFETKAEKLNVQINSMTTMPVGIASLNWYGIIKDDNYIHLSKYGLFGEWQDGFNSFPINKHLFESLPKVVGEKMSWFAKDNYVLYQDGGKIRIYNLQVDMRGVVEEKGRRFPTAGYFEATPIVGQEFLFSSGAHE